MPSRAEFQQELGRESIAGLGRHDAQSISEALDLSQILGEPEMRIDGRHQLAVPRCVQRSLGCVTYDQRGEPRAVTARTTDVHGPGRNLQATIAQRQYHT